MSCATMTSLGAYVLGALDAGERDRVDAHVADCPACLQELESLLPVRACLTRMTTEDALALDAAPAPPAALRARLRTAARAERRRLVRRRGAAVAAAAALLATVALAAVATWPDRQSPSDAGRAEAADARTGVRASVATTPRPWGTEVSLRLSGVTPGERCRLIARGRDGRSDVAASWWASYRGTADVTGVAAIPAAKLVAFDVVTASGRRLVRIPINPHEGAPA